LKKFPTTLLLLELIIYCVHNLPADKDGGVCEPEAEPEAEPKPWTITSPRYEGKLGKM